MDAVAEFLRNEKDRLVEQWEDEVRREIPALQKMARPALIDHLPELLEALAAWIEGRADQAHRGFQALVEGHALQRLGYAVGLETLMREYAKIRFVLIRELVDVPARRESMLLLNEGLDRAIGAAIDRYSQRREDVRARFISILGHDLRDPLATVKISSDVLARSTNLTEEQQHILARIARACDRMHRMVGEVLDFARGHLGGGIPANPTLNDLTEICRAVVEDAAAKNPGRRIVLEASGDLRGPFDHDRVVQAISNLVGNAIEHTREAVEVGAHETGDRSHVITTVTSHGVAIPPELHARLFDPFARGDDSVARHGLGLGLYIVHQIALAHGATIDLTSDAAATTFTITWPRVHDEKRFSVASE